MSGQDMKAITAAALERWNAGDLDGYLAIYDPACVTHGLAPGPVDLAGLRGFYEMIYGAFDPRSVDPADLVAEGDRLVVRYTFRGTHIGELMGTPASAAAVEMTGMTMLRFENGRIVERWQNADLFGLMQQIGAIPAPAVA